MGRVIDITKLITANNALIQATKKLKAIEAEILKHGDMVQEGNTCRLIVKDGKIKLIQKVAVSTQNKAEFFPDIT